MAFAPTGTFISRNSRRLEEILGKNIEVFLPMLDVAYRDTIVTSQGVGQPSRIGRDMKILKTYAGSFAGVLEEGKPRGDFSLYGDQTNAVGTRIFTQTLAQTFPDALEGANALTFELGIPMRSMVANIMMTMGELQAEATPAFIGEVVAPKLEGFARLIAHTLCNKWWLNQNNSYAISNLASTALTAGLASGTLVAGGTTPNFTLTFSPHNQACDRYFIGQRVDIYDTTGVTRKNQTAGGARIWLYVTAVDELLNKVTLTTATGGGTPAAFHDTTAGSIIVLHTDIVVYANSRDSSSPTWTSFAGVNNWLKGGTSAGSTNDQYLLGAERDTSAQIDVNLLPEFKSFTRSHGGAPMTEHVLRQILRRFHSAKNKYGQYIDCLIASDGVWLNYEGQRIGREYIDRTGSLSNMNSQGSAEGFTFHFDGRTYKGYTSTYVESGTIYGIRKGGNNWKRYVPPDPKGAKKMNNLEEFAPFRFVGSILTGTDSNQIPIQFSNGNTTQLTEGAQMPGVMRMQLVPDQPAGLKITSVAEDRLYADA